MAAFAIILQSVLPRLQAEPPKEALSLSKLIHEHSVIYRSASISAAGWGWLFYTFSFVSILTLLPPFLDPSERALVMGAMPLVSIAVSLSIGVWMMRILSAVQVIQIGFVISALCAVLLGVWQGQAVLCLCLAGALGLVQGASFAAVPQLNDMPATQAQANGAMAQMGNIGNTIGTPVMAAMIAGFGYKGMILSAVVTLLAGAWAHYRLAGRRAV
jgi:predicted MFS family arabinose efflux permease